MLTSLTIFLAALALAWGVGLWAASKIDPQTTPVPQWPPAFFIASYLVNGLHARAFAFFGIVGLIFVFGGVFFHNAFGIFLLIAALIIFAPLAFFLCYKIRQNTELSSKEYVFLDTTRPISAQDEKRDFALYIEDDDWATIPAATPYYLNFWQQYRVTGGLYICPCENDVLQAIDSLNLYKYLVNPHHPKMLNAFAGALSVVHPSNMSQTPYAKRVFVQLQTQAKSALAFKKKERGSAQSSEAREQKLSRDLPPEIMKMFKQLEEKEKLKGPQDKEDDDDDEDLDDWEKEFLKELEEEHKKSQEKKSDDEENPPQTRT